MVTMDSHHYGMDDHVYIWLMIYIILTYFNASKWIAKATHRHLSNCGTVLHPARAVEGVQGGRWSGHMSRVASQELQLNHCGLPRLSISIIVSCNCWWINNGTADLGQFFRIKMNSEIYIFSWCTLLFLTHTHNVPPGNLTVCYWTLPFTSLNYPLNTLISHSFWYVYQLVSFFSCNYETLKTLGLQWDGWTNL